MDLDVTILRTHLDYTAWASARLVTAASALSPEELTRDFQTADHSVLGTLVHAFAADRIWFARIQGNPPRPFIDPEKDMRLEVLQNDWPKLMEQWRNWAAGLTSDSLGSSVQFKDLKGNTHETVVWKVVLHLVNHGTHHRGQVSGFLRAMGHPPPPLDLMAYYRTL